jgi:hypothetical protein
VVYNHLFKGAPSVRIPGSTCCAAIAGSEPAIC